MADIFFDSPAAAKLHGSNADEVDPGLRDLAIFLVIVDHDAMNAAPAKLARERKTDWPTSDDQHVRVHQSLGLDAGIWNN